MILRANLTNCQGRYNYLGGARVQQHSCFGDMASYSSCNMARDTCRTKYKLAFSMVEIAYMKLRPFLFFDLVNPNLFTQWAGGSPLTKINQLIDKYSPLFNVPNL